MDEVREDVADGTADETDSEGGADTYISCHGGDEHETGKDTGSQADDGDLFLEVILGSHPYEGGGHRGTGGGHDGPDDGTSGTETGTAVESVPADPQ